MTLFGTSLYSERWTRAQVSLFKHVVEKLLACLKENEAASAHYTVSSDGLILSINWHRLSVPLLMHVVVVFEVICSWPMRVYARISFHLKLQVCVNEAQPRNTRALNGKYRPNYPHITEFQVLVSAAELQIVVTPVHITAPWRGSRDCFPPVGKVKNTWEALYLEYTVSCVCRSGVLLGFTFSIPCYWFSSALCTLLVKLNMLHFWG